MGSHIFVAWIWFVFALVNTSISHSGTISRFFPHHRLMTITTSRKMSLHTRMHTYIPQTRTHPHTPAPPRLMTTTTSRKAATDPGFPGGGGGIWVRAPIPKENPMWGRESVPLAVADIGARGAPPGHPNSFDFMQFSGKFGKIVCWRPPPLGELAPPPQGNLGSAAVWTQFFLF